MVDVIRQWLVRLLRAWLVWVEPGAVASTWPGSGTSAWPVPGRAPVTGLPLAAQEWVRRMSAQQVSTTTKRQIVMRALRAAFPAVKQWEINLAIEEAVRDVKEEKANG